DLRPFLEISGRNDITFCTCSISGQVQKEQLSYMKLFLLWILYSGALSMGLARPRVPSRTRASSGAGRKGSMRVLIIGASGGTGRQLVNQALERGHTVTAFVRDPSRLSIQHPKLKIIKGDVLDYSSVEGAVHGQEAVISALGHHWYF